MLVVQPLSSAAARYYFGHGHSEEGRWLGKGVASLGLGGAVRLDDLEAVLEGREPREGRFLPEYKPARRRAGWDLVFAAPKSVSLLDAAMDVGGQPIRTAHRCAVEATLDHMERTLLRARRGGRLTATTGAVAACFDHSSNASGEPHVHSHLVLANLAADHEGAWSALAGGWWPARRSLGALYQLALRHEMRAAGLELDWRLHGDGLADVAGLPRAAVRAASRRSIELRAGLGEVGSSSGRPSARSRRAAAGRSRPQLPSPVAGDWAGFGSTEAARLATERRSAMFAGASIEDRVEGWLTSRRSSFGIRDVMVALAACSAEGMEPAAAEDFAARFVSSALRSTTRGWTTRLSRSADARLLEIESRWRTLPGPTAPDLAGTSLAEHSALGTCAAAAVRRLLGGERPIEIMAAPAGTSNLLSHAAVLDAAASAWLAAGRPVTLLCEQGASLRRWETLTCVDGRGSVATGGVLVIDGADRMPTPSLLVTLEDAARRGAQVVLVEGGTSGRLSQRRSDGLALMGDRLGRLDPGPAPGWAPALGVGRGVVDAGGVGAARRLVRSWFDDHGDRLGTLVGLGAAEVDGLNQAARSLLASIGRLEGPGLEVRGRELKAGDRVVALRQLAAGVPAATTGTILEVHPRRAYVDAFLGGERRRLDRGALAHLGHGYAVTPNLATRVPGSLLVLGPAAAVGRSRDRVLVAERAIQLPVGMARARDLGLGL